jgi:NADP-dependent 3-hydroxy acid dehydrogenase YdfG
VSEPGVSSVAAVVIGSAGLGLETARQARSEGAHVVLTGRDPQRLEEAADELGALASAGSPPSTLPGQYYWY